MHSSMSSELHRSLEDFMCWYNGERIHSSLWYHVPSDVYFGKIVFEWTMRVGNFGMSFFRHRNKAHRFYERLLRMLKIDWREKPQCPIAWILVGHWGETFVSLVGYSLASCSPAVLPLPHRQWQCKRSISNGQSTEKQLQKIHLIEDHLLSKKVSPTL